MPPTTGLLPIDPAVSPQQVNRILPIRANLLPSEITSGRNARRIRFGLLGAMLVVIALIAAWYLYAVRSVEDAENNRDAIAAQVQDAQRRKKSHEALVSAKEEKEEITATLSSLLANDLPWATMVDNVRAASPSGLTAATITATLNATDAEGAPLGLLTVTGTAKDKKTVANYVDALSKVKGVANPYLTTASKSDADRVAYTITADIISDALCGRFTKTCKTGGK